MAHTIDIARCRVWYLGLPDQRQEPVRDDERRAAGVEELHDVTGDADAAAPPAPPAT